MGVRKPESEPPRPRSQVHAVRRTLSKVAMPSSRPAQILWSGADVIGDRHRVSHRARRQIPPPPARPSSQRASPIRSPHRKKKQTFLNGDSAGPFAWRVPNLNAVLGRTFAPHAKLERESHSRMPPCGPEGPSALSARPSRPRQRESIARSSAPAF